MEMQMEKATPPTTPVIKGRKGSMELNATSKRQKREIIADTSNPTTANIDICIVVKFVRKLLIFFWNLRTISIKAVVYGIEAIVHGNSILLNESIIAREKNNADNSIRYFELQILQTRIEI